MANYGLLNILNVLPQMVILLYGQMGRIYVRTNREVEIKDMLKNNRAHIDDYYK